MPHSHLLRQECSPVETSGAIKHVVFSCLQWSGPNLETRTCAGHQRFALVYDGALDDRRIRMLERALILGALPPVTLIVDLEAGFYVFVDSAVTNGTIRPTINLWAKVMGIDQGQPWAANIFNESDLYSGKAIIPLPEQAKQVHEMYSLGINDYDLPSLDPDLGEENDGEVSDLNQLRPAHSQRPQSNVSLLITKQLSNAAQGFQDGTHPPEKFRNSNLHALMSKTKIHEITELTVRDIIYMHSAVGANLEPGLFRGQDDEIDLSPMAGRVIAMYIRAKKLSETDPLFPSADGSRAAMSVCELEKIYHEWLTSDQINPMKTSVGVIRRCMTDLMRKAELQYLAEECESLSFHTLTVTTLCLMTLMQHSVDGTAVV